MALNIPLIVGEGMENECDSQLKGEWCQELDGHNLLASDDVQ